MKFILALTLTTLLLSQSVTQLSSFSAVNTSELTDLVLAWEIEAQDDNSGSYVSNYRIGDNRGEKSTKLYNLSSKTGTTVFAIGFNEDAEANMVIHGGADNIDLEVRGKVLWLGKQTPRSSYEFVKKLAEAEKQHKNLYGLLPRHGFHEETFTFFKKKYRAATSEKEKKNIMFYIGSIPSEMVIPFLDEVYMQTESDDLKKRIIFAYHANKTEKSLKRLMFVAKHDSDTKMRKKALFWLGQRAGKQMEKYFSDIVFSDEQIEIKKSAIFALYNMKNEDKLKYIVQNAKDIRLRKKALFWLGQLGTDVEFFESIFAKN